MAHILCITSGLTGILHASFEMAARLEAAGHQVTCASPREVGERVTAQGFSYIQLNPVAFDPAPEVPPFKGTLKKWKRWWYKVQYRSPRKEAALVALGMEEFKKKVAAISPDFLIIDIELHEHLMTAYSMQWPMCLLSQWFSLWHQKGLPPIVHDTIPKKGWQGSAIGIALAWWKIKCQRRWMFEKKRILSVGTDRRSILKTYAQRINFPSTFIKENYWPGPFTYDQLPVIAITAEELEFPHRIRAGLEYVGPMVFAARKESIDTVSINEKIDSILAKAKEEGKSILYTSVSTFRKGDQGFLKKVIKAVSQENQWILIIGMGGKIDQKEMVFLPQNVFAFTWVPQLKVLAQTDCSINHGGIHTINECLHFKVPMLVYSGKRSDQNGCAARVTYHGIGIMADKDQDTPQDINNKVKKILSTPSYREKMDLFHTYYLRYKNQKRLSKIIEQMLLERKKKKF